MENPTYPSEPRPEGASGGSSRPPRRRLILAGSIALIVFIAVPLVAVALSGKSRATVTTTASDPTTVAPPAPTTSVAASTTTADPVTTIAPPTTTAPSRSTTTTALACHDSYNSACGAFHWNPAPAPADPVLVSVDYSPQNPVAGDTVNFTVHFSDPNTSVAPCGKVDSGMGFGGDCAIDYPACTTRYGSWNPPAKTADSGTRSYSFQYKDAGTYTFSVDYATGTPCYDPYQGHATGSVSFTVAPQPTTTTAANAPG